MPQAQNGDERLQCGFMRHRSIARLSSAIRSYYSALLCALGRQCVEFTYLVCSQSNFTFIFFSRLYFHSLLYSHSNLQAALSHMSEHVDLSSLSTH